MYVNPIYKAYHTTVHRHAYRLARRHGKYAPLYGEIKHAIWMALFAEAIMPEHIEAQTLESLGLENRK